MKILRVESNSAASAVDMFEPGMVILTVNNFDMTQMNTVREAEEYIERTYRSFEIIYFLIKSARK
jgi:hypothetical protein